MKQVNLYCNRFLNFLILFSSMVLLISPSFGEEEITKEREFKKDFKTSFNYLISASYEQFRTKTNLFYLSLGAPLTWYSLEEDKRLQSVMVKREGGKVFDIVSSTSIIMSFPVAPAISYSLGRIKNDDKLIQFSIELTSAMYLALAEAGILSHIHVHRRPDEEDLDFWETSFRGKSSFPSGHMVPYSVLFFKTFQFYGPYWSLIPLSLAYMVAHERIVENKHYMSDVVAAFFLAAFSSEGVRSVAGYKKNHPTYKWLFEHDFALGIARYKDAYGPRVLFSF